MFLLHQLAAPQGPPWGAGGSCVHQAPLARLKMVIIVLVNIPQGQAKFVKAEKPFQFPRGANDVVARIKGWSTSISLEQLEAHTNSVHCPQLHCALKSGVKCSANGPVLLTCYWQRRTS